MTTFLLIAVLILVIMFPWLLPLAIGLFFLYQYYLYKKQVRRYNESYTRQQREYTQQSHSQSSDHTSTHGQVKKDVIDAEYTVTEVEE